MGNYLEMLNASLAGYFYVKIMLAFTCSYLSVPLLYVL